MSDNVFVSSLTTGVLVGAEDVGGTEYQRVKLIGGLAGDVTGIGASGTIGISGNVVVSGAVSISAMPAITGNVVVSGAVSISAMPAISGAVSISAMPVVSVSMAQVSVVSTILGTAVVTLATGGVVTMVGTVAVQSPAVYSNTQLATIGEMVWLAPTQTINATVNTIAAGFSVQALVTGPVSISAMPIVSITGALVSIVSTVLGTQIVTLATGGVVTMVGAVSVTGVSINVVVSGPVSISALPAVSLISIPGTVGMPTSAATGLPVWIVGGQTVTGIPVAVSITAPVTTSQPGANASGVIAWNAGLPLTTGTPAAAATGQMVWLINPTTITATVTVSVSQPFGDVIAFSFTTVSAPTVITPALCTVSWLGTTVATSMYVVPAGRRLRIEGIVVQVQNTAASIGIANGLVYVFASASSSVTVGPVVALGFGAAPTNATNAAGGNVVNLAVDISTGMSVGLAYKVTGGTGHIIGFVIMGELF